MRLIAMTILGFACLSLIFVAGGGPVRAENGCPAGYSPWRVPIASLNDCIPIIADDRPTYAPPRAVWATRWGAISIGGISIDEGVGVASDRKSKGAARKAAIAQCIASGGSPGCKQQVLTYFNQCVAVSWGTRSYSVISAATLDKAIADATDDCRSRTDGCKLFYTNCTYAVRVR